MSRRAKGSPWIGCLSVRKARVGIGSVALRQRLDHQYYCAPIIQKSRAEKKQVTTLVGCLPTQQLPSDNHFVICGPKLALVLLAEARPMQAGTRAGHLLDFRPILRNRAALGYIFGYGAHCFELSAEAPVLPYKRRLQPHVTCARSAHDPSWDGLLSCALNE